MLRLFSAAVAAILITLPSIAATAAEKEGGEARPWQSLHSVVSYRGVRVNMVQPPAAPGDAVPAAEAAEVPAPNAEEVPDPAGPELPDVSLELRAEPAPNGEASPSPGDESETAPAVVPDPDACGPVRARIEDLSMPADAPPAVDAPAPFDAPLLDEIPVPGDTRPVKDATAQKGGHGKGCKSGGRGGLLGRRGGAACGAGGACGSSGIGGGLLGSRVGGGGGCDGCGGCGSGGLLGRGAGSVWCWCEMPQHLSYFPEMHGHYYFRPYNWSRIAEQQQTTTQWGEDPRNPYGRQVFQQVYAEYLAEKDGTMDDAADPFVDPEETVLPLPPEDN